MIDSTRVKLVDVRWDLITRIVVAVDPAVTSGENSDETGIVVCGLTISQHVIVIEDLTCRETPLGWARVAVAAYKNRRADRIVGEVNNGGDLVEANIRAVRSRRFRTARSGPAVERPCQRGADRGALRTGARASRRGDAPQLEDQMVSFVPGVRGDSPDRMDALVWAVTELLVDQEQVRYTIDATDYQEISPY